MKINKAIIDNILRTLPVGYYLGRRIEIELDETEETSRINLLEQKIYISYKQLLTNYEYNNFEDMEEDVRSNFYHEIGHSLLSPISKKIIIDTDIFNIFEDQRIETLLSSFFMNVNFRNNLLRHYASNQEPFFRAVRLNLGKAEHVKEVYELIYKYSNLRFTPSPINTIKYQLDIKRLYDKIINQNEENTGGENCKLSIEENKIIEKDIQDLKRIITDKKYVKNIFNKCFETLFQYDNTNFRKKIENILIGRHQLKKNEPTCRRSHFGKIEPKLIKDSNNDYKWFIKNKNGKEHYGSKVKLNIFLDKSGSTKSLETKFNSILHELYEVEKKVSYFSFDLIKIDTNFEISQKKDRIIVSEGGNSLSSVLQDIYHFVQTPGAQNLNIVLFQGDATTDDIYDKKQKKILKSNSREQKEMFRIFNRKEVLIISDYSNQESIKEYCKNAKTVLTSNYAEELENHILKFFAQNLI